MGPVVLKFGGTSVQDEAALRRLTAIVAGTPGARVVVVSALAGTTNALTAAARMPPSPERDAVLRALVDRHLALAAALTNGAAHGALIDHLTAMFDGAAGMLRRDRVLTASERDALLGLGELASSRLVAAVLAAAGVQARWVDARRTIVTDDRSGSARPLRDQTRLAAARELLPLVRAGIVPVLGGFVGATPEGTPTTLGRGGSDYSAGIVAAAVDAARVDIWTDVDGILSADPRIVPEAVPLRRLSALEAYDLARLGARVLHAGTLEPVAAPRIPVYVRNSRRPAGPATEIHPGVDPDAPPVAGVAHRPEVSVIDLVARDLGTSAPFLDGIAGCVDHGLQHAVTPIAVSPQRAVLAVDDAATAEAICSRMREAAEVASVVRGGLVSAVGQGVHSAPSVWRPLLALRERGAVHRIIQSSSGCALVAMTDRESVEDVVRELHAATSRPVMEVA